MSTWNMPPGASSADITGQDDSPLVVTEYIAPPIPTRSHDWMAHMADEDGPTGYGPSELEALRDLCEQLAMLYLEGRP